MSGFRGPVELDDVHRMLGAYVVEVYQLRKALRAAQQKLAEVIPAAAESAGDPPKDGPAATDET